MSHQGVDYKVGWRLLPSGRVLDLISNRICECAACQRLPADADNLFLLLREAVAQEYTSLEVNNVAPATKEDNHAR